MRFTREFGMEDVAESSREPVSAPLRASEKEIDEFIEFGRPAENSRPAGVRGDELPEPSLADPMDVANLDEKRTTS